jgi:U3 small nucleolar RNA-associated protein 21
VSFKTIPDQQMAEVALPTMQGLAEDEGNPVYLFLWRRYADSFGTALEGLASLTLQKESDLFVTPDQLDSELVTLTLLPRSRWQTLLNLDTIQACNL